MNMSPLLVMKNEEIRRDIPYDRDGKYTTTSAVDQLDCQSVLRRPVAVRPLAVRPLTAACPEPVRVGCVVEDDDVVRPQVLRPQVVRPQVVRPQVVRPQAVRPQTVRPHVVEDEEEVVRPQVVRPQPVRPIASVVKPIAMKVARPVPQRAAEQFYSETSKLGLPALAVHRAVLESHDWHRKWTQQDEEGHTMPEPQELDMNMCYVFPDFQLDREAGAKNPFDSVEESESSDEDDVDRKRARVEGGQEIEEIDVRMAFLQEGIPTEQVFPVRDVAFATGMDSFSTLCPSYSSEGSFHAPAIRRRLNEEDDVNDECAEDVCPPPTFNQTQSNIVRPVPVRVVAEPQEFEGVGIPHVIHDPREANGGNVSPLTHASDMTSGTKGFMFTLESNNDQMPAVVEDDCDVVSVYDDQEEPESFDFALKDSLLRELVVNGGEGSAEKFQEVLKPLVEQFKEKNIDTCKVSELEGNVEGTWLTLTKPTFFGCLGFNDAGDPLYTLGRMSFDMFSPTGLVCSLQGNFNQVEVVNDTDRQAMLDSGLVPKSLREEVENKEVVVRTYNIITAFTIEPPIAAYPNAPNKDVVRPIRGIMSTYGYTIPDPEHPNRHSIWITGGKIEPNGSPSDSQEWKRLFALHPPKHSFGEQAKLLAVKLLMGANVPNAVNDDGSMVYSFTRPLGGHGMAYIDVEYMDNSLRVVRGHRGTTFVFSRMENN